MESPIFILGSHKSGTTMLRGLLDGIPGVFSIPIETHIFEYTGHWVEYELRRTIPRKLTYDQVLGSIQQSLEKSNKKSNRFSRYGGDSLFEKQWNIPALLEYMNGSGRESFEADDLRGFITAYFESLYFSLFSKAPTTSLRYVEKSVENAEFAGLLKKIFPDAKFIHVIRNPYATLVSIRKYMALRGQYPYLGWIIDALENNYYYSVSNPLFIPDYLLVRYEDLILSTENKMREVAKFLDLPFEIAMLSPTSLGRSWPGNSVSGESFNGIATTPIHSWESQISPLEIALVNSNFDHILDKYKYKKIGLKSSPFLISNKEGVRNYLANRFFYLISSKRRKKEVD
jgi:protein-tyrosine sulfotransferase